MVSLNDNVHTTRILEKQFHVGLLFPSPTSNNTFDDGESAFEEEFIGPSMVDYGEEDGGIHGVVGSLDSDFEKSSLGLSPKNKL
ncbi:hypothetical protein Tco_0608324 [Tanacetum coccineum]